MYFFFQYSIHGTIIFFLTDHTFSQYLQNNSVVTSKIGISLHVYMWVTIEKNAKLFFVSKNLISSALVL